MNETTNIRNKLLSYEAIKVSLPISVIYKLNKKHPTDIKISKLLYRYFPYLFDKKNIEYPNMHLYYTINKNETPVIAGTGEVITHGFLNAIMKKITNYFGKKRIWTLDCISNIVENKQIDINTYTIDIYVFSSKHKKEHKDFKKIYRLLLDEIYSYHDTYSNSYFDTFELFGSFLTDSSKFFQKHFALILTGIVFYTIEFYQYTLENLGIPFNAISTLQLLSIIKLFSSAIFPYFSSLFMLPIIFIYFFSKSTFKQSLYNTLHAYFGVLVYYFIITLFFHHNFTQIKKENISIENSFLLQYFSENAFPKIMTDDTNVIVAVGSDQQFIYYYDLKKICSNFDKNISLPKNDHTKLLLTLLKYSSYADIKNVQFITIKESFDTYILLNESNASKTIMDVCKQ